MKLFAQAGIPTGGQPPWWIIDDPLASRLFERAGARTGFERLLLAPRTATQSGYQGILLTSLDDIRLSRKEDPIWRIVATREEQDAHLTAFESSPNHARARFGGSFEDLTQARSQDFPILGLEGPPATQRLACASAPSIPTGDDLRRWNGSAANCYRYANDASQSLIIANPGPGPDWEPVSENHLRSLVKSDGLDFLGKSEQMTCPVGNPAHIVAVFGRSPDGRTFRAYHCLRLDQDGFWSHKDGFCPVERLSVVSLHDARFTPQLTLVGFFRSTDNRGSIDSPP